MRNRGKRTHGRPRGAADVDLAIGGADRHHAGVDLNRGRGERPGAGRVDIHVATMGEHCPVRDECALGAVVGHHVHGSTERHEAALERESRAVVTFIEPRGDGDVTARADIARDVGGRIRMNVEHVDCGPQTDQPEGALARRLRQDKVVLRQHLDVVARMNGRAARDVSSRPGRPATRYLPLERRLVGLGDIDLRARALDIIADQLRVIRPATYGRTAGVVVAAQCAGEPRTGRTALLGTVGIRGTPPRRVRAVAAQRIVAGGRTLRAVVIGLEARPHRPHRYRRAQAHQSARTADRETGQVLARQRECIDLVLCIDGRTRIDEGTRVVADVAYVHTSRKPDDAACDATRNVVNLDAICRRHLHGLQEACAGLVGVDLRARGDIGLGGRVDDADGDPARNTHEASSARRGEQEHILGRTCLHRHSALARHAEGRTALAAVQDAGKITRIALGVDGRAGTDESFGVLGKDVDTHCRANADVQADSRTAGHHGQFGVVGGADFDVAARTDGCMVAYERTRAVIEHRDRHRTGYRSAQRKISCDRYRSKRLRAGRNHRDVPRRVDFGACADACDGVQIHDVDIRRGPDGGSERKGTHADDAGVLVVVAGRDAHRLVCAGAGGGIHPGTIRDERRSVRIDHAHACTEIKPERTREPAADGNRQQVVAVGCRDRDPVE